MAKKRKKTVGQVVYDNYNKTDNITATDLREALEVDYIKNLAEARERGKKEFGGRSFFVAVLSKKEKLLRNTIRHYFVARLTAPTPNYDMTVYQCDPKDDSLKFIFTIPDKETCLNLLELGSRCPQEYMDLLYNVIAFAQGDLFKLVQQLNEEDINLISVPYEQTFVEV